LSGSHHYPEEKYMVTKMKKPGADKQETTSGTHRAASVKDSAQQIWQAGLGAFAKAQAEGSKAFEAAQNAGGS
jgi:hypothetical protein